MPEIPTPSLRPFGSNERLSSSDLNTLRDWLANNCQPGIQLTVDYTVGDLVSDIDNMLNGMWSDGIDAMGEDA